MISCSGNRVLRKKDWLPLKICDTIIFIGNMVLNSDFREFIALLNANKVKYLIDLENLKQNKKASGRLQDLADLENLSSK